MQNLCIILGPQKELNSFASESVRWLYYVLSGFFGIIG